ncbi:hypothetical protein AgCh_027323 [Apium graveolens]
MCDFTATKIVDDPLKTYLSDSCFVGSCNGLVCLWKPYGRDKDDIFLWNPTTAEIKKLPEALNLMIPTKTNCIRPCEIGFGYDHVSDDYKVMRTVNSHFVGIMVSVYSLKNNSWTRAETNTTGYNFYGQFGHFVDGSLYWLAEIEKARIPDSYHVYPVAFSKAQNEVLLVVDRKRLVWYDCETGEVRNIELHGFPKKFDILVYEESPFQISDSELDGKLSEKEKDEQRTKTLLYVTVIVHCTPRRPGAGIIIYYKVLKDCNASLPSGGSVTREKQPEPVMGQFCAYMSCLTDYPDKCGIEYDDLTIKIILNHEKNGEESVRLFGQALVGFGYDHVNDDYKVVRTSGQIYAYDLGVHKQSELSFPPGFDKKNGKALHDFDKCLCFIGTCPGSRLDMWVLNNNRVEKSWSKLISVEQPGPGLLGSFEFMYPVAFSKDRNEILLMVDNNRLVWYDRERNQFKNVALHGFPESFDVLNYDESIFQINASELDS